MSRYIDADKLCRDVVASWDRDRHHTIEASRVHRQEHNHLRLIIEKQPTADVVEVRHGEWETIPDYSRSLTTYRHICSVCKTTYKDIRPHGHNYCHVCGAKMDGERREQNER